MLRLPLTLVLGLEPPPKRHVFDQLCASREGSRNGGDCSRTSSLSSITYQGSGTLSSQSFGEAYPTAQGFLPPSVLQHVIQHVEYADLKALHRVSRAWREAVCYGLRTVAPTNCSPKMLKRFPKIEVMGMERLTFSEPHLAKMTGLRTLIIHNCNFEHPISDLSSLRGLQRLKIMDVKANSRDMDALFSSLRGLTSLEIYRLSGQKTLPAMSTLSSLTALQELVISDSHHRERLPHLTQISNLSKLQILTLLKVRVDCGILMAMSTLTDLRSLEIPDCYRVNSSALPALSPLTGLTRLDIRSTYRRREEELLDYGIASLATLTELRSLNLAGHISLTGEGLHFLSSFTDLTELSLYDIPLWTDGAAFMSCLTALTSLNVAHTQLSSENLGFLDHLQGLRALDISQTFADDNTANQIAQMVQLETLKMGFSHMKNVGLRAIVDGCPNLKYVYIDGCAISTLCMLHVVRQRPSLRLWTKGNTSLPNWMYKIDAVLIAQTDLYARRLRILHQGEGSLPTTLGVLMGVVAFFLLYFALLFLIFTAVFLIPLAALGVLCLLVGVFALVIKVTYAAATLIHSLVVSGGRLCGVGPLGSNDAADADQIAEMV